MSGATDIDDPLDSFDEAPDLLEVRLDVADLFPPEPLTETLEAAEALDDGVLLQVNDRAPQHLYPKLQERGFAWETREGDDGGLSRLRYGAVKSPMSKISL